MLVKLGIRVGKVFNKAGWPFYQNAELIFENARVPHANIVGEVSRSGCVVMDDSDSRLEGCSEPVYYLLSFLTVWRNDDV